MDCEMLSLNSLSNVHTILAFLFHSVIFKESYYKRLELLYV